MKIACVGGGPAGLYFAISMKVRDPAHEVTVFERNAPGETFGWGVVLSDQTVENLRANDPVTGETIAAGMAHWDDIEVQLQGERIRSSGHGFTGIGRWRLLNILLERARELGVRLAFDTEVAPELDAFAGYDLVIAADGVNSRFRTRYREAFEVDIDERANRYIWLGTHKLFEAFTFAFEETGPGWIWAHAYQFDANSSTFIVECPEQTWRGLGFDRMAAEDSRAECERIFAGTLEGQWLLDKTRGGRGASWLHFNRVLCGRWRHHKLVLLGDAAHTAHFSIGSGTKLAVEDAIHLAAVLNAGGAVDAALADYEEARRVEVLKLQSAARNSTEWFENVPRYLKLAPLQFAYSLLTRSQRVSHENLRSRDRAWLERVERWFAGPTRAAGRGANAPAVPPMFVPFRLRELELANRVVVSPMDMYSAEDGLAGDFHLVHLGSRAQGGAGLVCTEMTCVTPEGRITPGCAGMYRDEHVAAWRRITGFIHEHTGAKVCLQLGHAGPKGATKLMWEGMDEPLEEGGWELIGPSSVPYSPRNAVPRAMGRADLESIKEAFVRATYRAIESGFDMIELHCAHGYLLSAFITPLANCRRDDYGGPLANRLRYPLEVFSAMRAVWPPERPMSVRISATDWVAGGIDGAEAVEIARAFHAAGADIIDVSAGQTSPEARPVYGRMFQTPFSDQIRNEAAVPTMAVGNIFEPDHVNSILVSGRADLCCLARPHLADPYWSLRAAAALGFAGAAWPKQYQAGAEQLARNLSRAEAAASV